MSLKERLTKPLLDAQYEKGVADASPKYEAWKTRQEAAEVVFVPDPEEGAEDSTERPASEK